VSRIEGTRALVTGGAGGLGIALGERLLERRASRVELWDIDAGALAGAAARLARAGAEVVTAVVDVGDAEQVAAAAVRAGAIDLLINNAGVVTGRVFVGQTDADIERCIRVNVLGPMRVTRALLPGMIERGRGHVANVASAAGLLPNPGMTVYAASKWAVVGWSESLRVELARAGSAVRVTTFVPSFIDTGLFAGVRPPRLTPWLSPRDAAQRLVGAIERNRTLVPAPFMVRLIRPLQALLPPRWFDRVVGDGFGVYRTMDTFVGRE
jgi:short-subunit dehydrogenase